MEKTISFVGGEEVSDSEPMPLQRLQHHLQRLALVQMDQDLQAAGAKWFDPGDERRRGHTEWGSGGGEPGRYGEGWLRGMVCRDVSLSVRTTCRRSGRGTAS